MIGSQHEDHLEEAAGVIGETAAEPKEGHYTTDANFFFEDIGDGHAGV